MRNARYWYIIVYDIRCPRRLQRIHRHLKKQGYALQESVFAWEGDAAELLELQTELKKRMSVREDDIRGYRLPAHQTIQLFGVSPFANGVIDSGTPPHELHALSQLNDPNWVKTHFFTSAANKDAAA